MKSYDDLPLPFNSSQNRPSQSYVSDPFFRNICAKVPPPSLVPVKKTAQSITMEIMQAGAPHIPARVEITYQKSAILISRW